MLAVQWHPEETLEDLRLFTGLVEAAARRAQKTKPAPPLNATPPPDEGGGPPMTEVINPATEELITSVVSHSAEATNNAIGR